MSQNQLANVLVNFLVYSDGAQTNNPKMRDCDFFRQFIAVPTGNSFGRTFDIPASSNLVVVTTVRTLSQDATTQYTVSFKTGSGYTYRFLHVGGTNPVLRTHRASALAASTVFNVTRVGDVVRYTWSGVGTDPNFVSTGSVVYGDEVTIEPFTLFNVLNQGPFIIVNVTDDYFEVVNPNGVAETGIVLGASSGGVVPMDIYSAAGIQVFDSVRISDTRFNIENRGDFEVSAVTSSYFEVSNGNPGIPQGPITLQTASGIVFYPDIYKWLYLESDQKVSVRINGDTSDNVVIEPVTTVIPPMPGVYLQGGGIYKLEIMNNGIATAQVKVALAE